MYDPDYVSPRQKEISDRVLKELEKKLVDEKLETNPLNLVDLLAPKPEAEAVVLKENEHVVPEAFRIGNANPTCGVSGKPACHTPSDLQNISNPYSFRISNEPREPASIAVDPAKEQLEADESYLETGVYDEDCGKDSNPPCPSKEALEKYKVTNKTNLQAHADEDFLKTGIYSKSCGMDKNPPCPSKEALEKLASQVNQRQKQSDDDFLKTGYYSKSCGMHANAPCPSHEAIEARKQIDADEDFLKTGVYSKSCGMDKNPPCPSKQAIEKYKALQKDNDADFIGPRGNL